VTRGHARLALALVAVAAAGAIASASPARAHVTSLSYSSWDVGPEGARVEARVTSLDLSALAGERAERGLGDADGIGSYLASHLRMRSGGGPCALAGGAPTRLASAEGWATYEWRVACPPGSGRVVESDLFSPENPSHLHFARIRLPDGDVAEHVLAEGERTWALPHISGSGAAAGGSFLGYVALGVEHILTGWDHLAFVIALLLLAGTLGELATLVTAFTVAHSVTLALAVLGVLRPDARAVEALIAFSIALVAAENVWLLAGRGRGVPLAAAALLAASAAVGALRPSAVTPLALAGLGAFSLCHFGLLDRADRPGRLRAAVAFAFGLVHGFGFAGVLAEMDLPRARLALALVGFNAGVEVGQLAVVAVAWPLLRLVGRVAGAGAERLVAEMGSAAICAVGVFWFLTRALA